MTGDVLQSFLLALRQLGDPRILRILGKSFAVTLLLFALLGWAGWYALDRGIALAGLGDGLFGWGDETRGLLALILTLLGGWLLWRVIAMAVIQFFADEVVQAVEARHYPAAAHTARQLGLRRELVIGLRGALRAVLANLAALPFALALLITGIGTALLFWAVNAVLLGRELQDMVWLRHQHDSADAAPPGRWPRFLLGGVVAGLMLLPVIQFLAPVLGAAAATHLIHRKGAQKDA
jgi:CysZ protein